MEKDQDHTDFIDRITGFAMGQTSRRSFFKWIGKGGLALAASITVGIEFLSGTAFASVPCSAYLPGCLGPCTCMESVCADQDGAGTQTCRGECPVCGVSDGVYYQPWIYWYWNGSRCVPEKLCDQCVA